MKNHGEAKAFIEWELRTITYIFWIDEDNAKVQVTSVIYVARDQATQLEFMEIE